VEYDRLRKKADAEHNEANAEHRRLAQEAQRRLNVWSAINPKPSAPAMATKEVWVRRITCGGCGRTDESVVDLSKGKAPARAAGWERLFDGYGPVVCPDCILAHQGRRAEFEAWKKNKDEAVARHFRVANAVRVPYRYPRISGWRTPG
jgi:hypothetical protein